MGVRLARFRTLVFGLLALAPAVVWQARPQPAVPAPGAALAAIEIDYPLAGSVFPPEITPPLFIWRDQAESASSWAIEITFAGAGEEPVRAAAPGDRMRTGEIDPRAVAPTNVLPRLTAREAAARTWRPDPGTWAIVKQRSFGRTAEVRITGLREGRPVSSGRVVIGTSRDPVGAPVFYRDVPLMPSVVQKGVIKPLAPSAIPLIAWRLRDIAEERSTLLLENLPTCANCHSFSKDGKTLGMDVDGPDNDKGMYTMVAVGPRIVIRKEDVFTWNDFPGKKPSERTLGFMSQVSPDGRYALSTVNEEVHVSNFEDYRFLQVFYPTRGILAWYDRKTRRMQSLPGADDPRYVQTDGVFSPDGSYVVFTRAEAADSYPEGLPVAKYANDPNEVRVKYDLYRIPFNGGRGGQAAPIEGASRNGMSNSFPKVSPDGRWIVFVRCRNGQLLRPDGELFIVPAAGGQARRMRCNTPLMNSWHSFSPNGRWMVFSSKGRSPYTQMFLTHIDEQGNDTPAILIENATAANRAVNLPEFVNVPPGGLAGIDVPAVDFFRAFDRALDLAAKGNHEQAVAAWREVLRADPTHSKAHNNMGVELMRLGRVDEALSHFRQSIEFNPRNSEGYNNLGMTLGRLGRFGEAIAQLNKALEIDPDNTQARSHLGSSLARAGRLPEAIVALRLAVAGDPRDVGAHNDLGVALFQTNAVDEAISHFRRAAELDPKSAESHYNLGRGLAKKGDLEGAIRCWRAAVERDADYAEAHFALGEALFLKRDSGGALAEWLAGLRVQPDYLPVLTRSAWLLAASPDASLRDGSRAVELAERALRLSSGGDPDVLDALAAAYAEAGRFPEAAAAARRALPLLGPAPQAAVSERIRLYETRRPFRMPPGQP